MKKAMKKIIVAGVALVAALGLATGTTFAWFSMNNSVDVTGMTVTTEISSNLFIASDTIGSTAKLGDANFSSSLAQNVTGKLEPVSTVDGKTFYYTKHAKANGAIEDDAVFTLYTDNSAFATYYGVANAVAYVDYVFQLKAVVTSTASSIYLTTLDLTYSRAADASTAYRVAVFCEDVTSGTATAAPGTLKAIFAESTAVNQTPNQAINGTAYNAKGAVSYNGTSAGKLIDISGTNTSAYYKVVVRMWLEGEDTTCKNDTFLDLTSGSWALSLGFTLDATTSPSNATPVTGLTKNVTTTP